MVKYELAAEMLELARSNIATALKIMLVLGKSIDEMEDLVLPTEQRQGLRAQMENMRKLVKDFE